MKTYIAYGAFFLALVTAAVGCDNKSGGNANVVTPTTCNAPNYINGNGICVNPSGVDVNGPMTYSDSNGSGYYSSGSLRITDQTAYKSFLKTAMGVCDRFNSNTGDYDCASWVNGNFQIQVQVAAATANQATVQFYATQRPQGWGTYWGVQTQLPYQNPLSLPSSALSVINNYAGFDISRQVNLNTVQVIVRTGKLGDATINYELAYGSQAINPARVFATGTLTRSY